MSDLVILYPAFPRTATMSGTAGATDYGLANLRDGDRALSFRASSSSATTSNSDYDFGASVTKQPQYAVWAGINRMVARDSADITLNVIGSASGSFTSPETETIAVGLSDLIGPQGEDYVLETSFGTAYRYFRQQVATTDSVQHTYKKAWIGDYLDLGRDPSRPKRIGREREEEDYREDPHEFDLAWKGLTNSVVATLTSEILAHTGSPIFLYTKSTSTTDSALNGNRLMHCIITRQSLRRIAPNATDFTAQFRELI